MDEQLVIRSESFNIYNYIDETLQDPEYEVPTRLISSPRQIFDSKSLLYQGRYISGTSTPKHSLCNTSWSISPVTVSDCGELQEKYITTSDDDEVISDSGEDDGGCDDEDGEDSDFEMNSGCDKDGWYTIECTHTDTQSAESTFSSLKCFRQKRNYVTKNLHVINPKRKPGILGTKADKKEDFSSITDCTNHEVDEQVIVEDPFSCIQASVDFQPYVKLVRLNSEELLKYLSPIPSASQHKQLKYKGRRLLSSSDEKSKIQCPKIVPRNSTGESIHQLDNTTADHKQLKCRGPRLLSSSDENSKLQCRKIPICISTDESIHQLDNTTADHKQLKCRGQRLLSSSDENSKFQCRKIPICISTDESIHQLDNTTADHKQLKCRGPRLLSSSDENSKLQCRKIPLYISTDESIRQLENTTASNYHDTQGIKGNYLSDFVNHIKTDSQPPVISPVRKYPAVLNDLHTQVTIATKENIMTNQNTPIEIIDTCTLHVTPIYKQTSGEVNTASSTISSTTPININKRRQTCYRKVSMELATPVSQQIKNSDGVVLIGQVSPGVKYHINKQKIHPLNNIGNKGASTKRIKMSEVQHSCNNKRKEKRTEKQMLDNKRTLLVFPKQMKTLKKNRNQSSKEIQNIHESKQNPQILLQSVKISDSSKLQSTRKNNNINSEKEGADKLFTHDVISDDIEEDILSQPLPLKKPYSSVYIGPQRIRHYEDVEFDFLDPESEALNAR